MNSTGPWRPSIEFALALLLTCSTLGYAPNALARDGVQGRFEVAQSHVERRRVFLTVESDRLTVYLPESGAREEVRRLPNERILSTGTTKLLAVASTTKRYLGCGVASRGWRSVPRLPNEEVIDLRAENSAAIILTSHRVLTFDGRAWTRKTRPRTQY